MVQRKELRVGVLCPRLVAACHVGRDVPGPREVGALPFQRPCLHQVRPRAPTARRLHFFVACPGLFSHLTCQCFNGTAALHGVGVLAETSFFAQDVLDVSSPALSTNRFLAVVVRFSYSVPTNFEAIHASQHCGIRRHRVAEQRIASALGMQAQGRRLGLNSNDGTRRHAHGCEQPRPQGTSRAHHGHARQNVGAEGEAQRRMLRRVLQRPTGRDKDVQGFLRGAERGAERVDMEHATVLPFGRVHAPNMKRRHRHVPRLGVKCQGLCVKIVLASCIPRA